MTGPPPSNTHSGLSAAPEPASLAIFGFAAFGMAGASLRRRRK
ncbi:PEP-CTERM sorting domain-containing protein [Novipirellula artificiosorum]